MVNVSQDNKSMRVAVNESVIVFKLHVIGVQYIGRYALNLLVTSLNFFNGFQPTWKKHLANFMINKYPGRVP